MPNELTREIQAQLTAKFNPADVDFRVMTSPTNGTKGRVCAYIDARVVEDRLDEVVGSGNWSYDFSPVVIQEVSGKLEMTAAKGTLTVFGVPKSALGTASQTEASKGCDSDTLKRTAVRFGIGRYLYDIKIPPVELTQSGRSWYIPNETLRQLRATYLGDNTARPQAQQEPIYDEPSTAAPSRSFAPQAPVSPPLGTRPAAGSSAWNAAVSLRNEGKDAECPTCHGPMWDNRAGKAIGKGNPNGPDFKCKNNNCRDTKGYTTSIFPPKPGEVQQAASGGSNAEAPEEFDAEPANPQPVLSKGDALRDYAEAVQFTAMPDNPDEEYAACHYYLNTKLGIKTMPLEEFDHTKLTPSQLSLLTQALMSGDLGWDAQ